MFSSSPASFSSSTPSLRETAGLWWVRQQAGLTAAEQAEFAAWLGADQLHASAYAEAEAAWNLLHFPRRAGQSAEALAGLQARSRMRRRRVARVFSLGGIAATFVLWAVVSLQSPSLPPNPQPRSTIAVRPDRQALADGSTVELNANAKIDVQFTPDRRTVHLLGGEALFTVAKDSTQRPFVVVAPGVEVKADGTVFSVRVDSTAVKVLVTEGRVIVTDLSTQRRTLGLALRAAAAADVVLDASCGMSVPFSDGDDSADAPAVDTFTAEEVAAALAWREKRLEFTGTPLADAVAMFNRQTALQLELADVSTGEVQLTGIFWSDDVEAFVRLLESGLDIESHSVGDRIQLRRR